MSPRSGNPLVSVVIPCRGHARELDECLASLRRQRLDGPYEVVVVDAGEDGAVAAVASRHPWVRTVREATNLLPGAARNAGARRATGARLAFIDADCVAEPDWLASAMIALTDGAVLVGGPVLDRLPRHPVAVADNLLQFADYPAGRPEGAATYFPGCNFALARATFEDAGGFREDLPVGEDVLLTGTLAARWPDRVRFLPEMRVRHTGRTGMRAMWRHHESFGFFRGRIGFQVTRAQRRLGRHAILLAPMASKRLLYILGRSARLDPWRLPWIVALSPIWITGLLAWARGFRDGCRQAWRAGGL